MSSAEFAKSCGLAAARQLRALKPAQAASGAKPFSGRLHNRQPVKRGPEENQKKKKSIPRMEYTMIFKK